ncbi:hypothetical protein PG991_013115 [Apiospora marii]|uniref:Uncharacterized protein n=1 Tax=Apiospora marii TaxID=335849 RepID=A0ABR1R542_9PEZI
MMARRLEKLTLASSSTPSSRQSHRVLKAKPRNNNHDAQAHQPLVHVRKEYSRDKDLLELYVAIDVRSAKTLATGVEKRLDRFSGMERIQVLARFLRIAMANLSPPKNMEDGDADYKMNRYHQKAQNLLRLLEVMLAAYADPSSPVHIEPSIEPLLLKHEHEWSIDPTVLQRIASPSPRVAFTTVRIYLGSLPCNAARFSDEVSASSQAWLNFLDRVPTTITTTATDTGMKVDEAEYKKRKKWDEEEEEGIRLTLLVLRATLVLYQAVANPEWGARYLLTEHVERALRLQKEQQQQPAALPTPGYGIRFHPRTSDTLKAVCLDYFGQTMAAVQALGGIRRVRRRLLYVDTVF